MYAPFAHQKYNRQKDYNPQKHYHNNSIRFKKGPKYTKKKVIVAKSNELHAQFLANTIQMIIHAFPLLGFGLKSR